MYNKKQMLSNMKIVEIDDDHLAFDNGCILTSDHEQDCCESHWLDFSVMSGYNVGTATGKTINIYEQVFDFSNGVTFKEVEDMGILLTDTEGNNYLVNGYGENNGYYGTNIDLVLYDENYKTIFEYDVSNCQKIDWCYKSILRYEKWAGRVLVHFCYFPMLILDASIVFGICGKVGRPNFF